MSGDGAGARPEMRVESATEDGGDAVVVTTGARFRFLAEGRIEAEQRLPSARACFAGTVEGARGGWRVESADGERAVVVAPALRAEVRDDSTVVLEKTGGVDVRVTPAFAGTFAARSKRAFVALDDHGGYGGFPEGTEYGRWRWTSAMSLRTWRDAGLGPGQSLRLAVFPPRPPDRRLVAWNVAHEGTPRAPLPTDDQIADAARTCRVLALHAYFWRAAPWRLRLRPGRHFLRGNAWRSARHEPADPDALARTMETARRHGMRIVLYVSPRHSTAADVVAEMARVLDVHRPDGLYLDGVTPLRGGDGLARLESVVRRTRALLGPERLLYLHPGDEPFGTPLVPCPFVDAHADFVLRGSEGRRSAPLGRFLRYAVAGWNVSGAVGVWCHYGSSGGVLPFERAPAAADVALAAASHARVWRRSRWGAAALAAFDAAWGPAAAAMVRGEVAAIDAADGSRGASGAGFGDEPASG